MTPKSISAGSVIGVLIVAVALLLWRIASDEKTIVSQSAGHDRKSQNDLIQLQQICAGQAEHVFTSEGWRLDGAADNGMSATYTNHYNAKLNKCFMLLAITNVSSSDKSISKTYALTDAFEGTTYAAYYASTPLGQLVPQIEQCSLSVPNMPEIPCHSAGEWQILVKPYIETGAMTL